jgi:DNA-binding MarR family transcriptional regulator
MDADRFEAAYRRIWRALRRPGEPGLPDRALQVLRQVAGGSTSLTGLAKDVGMPKSTASVLVKKLADMGLLTRARVAYDERRLDVALTDQGRDALAADTVLAPDRLGRALAALPAETKRALLAELEELAEVSERLPEPPGGGAQGAKR